MTLYLQAEAFEPGDLTRIAGEYADLVHAEVAQDLSPQPELAQRVGRRVRRRGGERGVRLELVPDLASRRQIDDDAAPLVLDGVDGGAQVAPPFGERGGEDVGDGRAGVDAAERRELRVERPLDEREDLPAVAQDLVDDRPPARPGLVEHDVVLAGAADEALGLEGR